MRICWNNNIHSTTLIVDINYESFVEQSHSRFVSDEYNKYLYDVIITINRFIIKYLGTYLPLRGGLAIAGVANATGSVLRGQFSTTKYCLHIYSKSCKYVVVDHQHIIVQGYIYCFWHLSRVWSRFSSSYYQRKCITSI